MKKIIVLFIITVCLLGLQAPVLHAQGYSYYKTFAWDTATNSDTLTFTLDRELEGAYEYCWTINMDALTGTNSGTFYVDQAGDNVGSATSLWGYTSSFAKGNVSVDTSLTGIVYGTNIRLRYITSGTLTSRVSATLALKKRPQMGGFQKDFLYKTFTADTAVNTTGVTFTYDKNLEGAYEYCFVINLDTISGTNSGTFYVDQASDNYGSIWGETYRLAHASDTPLKRTITGICYGTNIRLRYVGTGTMSSRVDVDFAFKKRPQK